MGKVQILDLKVKFIDTTREENIVANLLVMYY